MWLRGGFQVCPIILSRIDAALSPRRVFLTRTVEDDPGHYLDYSFPYWPLLITFSAGVTTTLVVNVRKYLFEQAKNMKTFCFNRKCERYV